MRSRDASFGRLWAGESVNLYAEQFFAFAMPLVVVTTLGAPDWTGQFLGFLFFAPYLAIGLQAGVLLERRSKRATMVWMSAAQGVVMAVVAASHLLGVLSTSLAIVAVAVSGVLAIFFQIAYQSFLPLLYSDLDDLQHGNSKLALSDAITRVAGPATAGLLLVGLGVTGAFALQFVLLVAATALFAQMHRDEPIQTADHRLVSMRSQIREGIALVHRSRWLNPIVYCGGVYTVFVTAVKTSVALYLVVEVGAGTAIAGVVIAMIALGYGIGSRLAPWSALRFGTRSTLVAGGVTSVVAVMCVGIGPVVNTGPTVEFVMGAFLFVHGIGDGMFAPTALSVRQVVTPSHLMARVTSVHRFVVWGGMAVGALLASLMTAIGDLRLATAISAFGVVITLPFMLRKNLSITPGRNHEKDPVVAFSDAQ